jgi:dipeptidase E
MDYLEHAEDAIRAFLGGGVRRTCFIPFAGVTISYDDYTARVRGCFEAMGYGLEGIHTSATPGKMIARAEAIVVGGGNTFHLLRELYEDGLLDQIRGRVLAGVPFIGWSAGSNVACPTIKTTNDMPIVEPPSLRALDLVPFQINPHYTTSHPPGHQGETRAQRIAEFVEANPDMRVVGLPEGAMLRLEGEVLTALGGLPLYVFEHNVLPARYGPEADLGFLLQP